MRQTNNVSWTEFEIAYLKENYLKLSSGKVAQQLFKTTGINRGRKAVECMARRQGLVKKHRWDEAETDYLEELIGEYSFAELVKLMHQWATTRNRRKRPPESIKAKIKHQKKSIRVNSSNKYLTKKDLKILLGCNRTSVNNLLNAYKKELKPQSDGGTAYVTRSRFRKFLLDHKHLLERYQNKLDIVWLADVLGTK